MWDSRFSNEGDMWDSENSMIRNFFFCELVGNPIVSDPV
jgi:hypothetical protein